MRKLTLKMGTLLLVTSLQVAALAFPPGIPWSIPTWHLPLCHEDVPKTHLTFPPSIQPGVTLPNPSFPWRSQVQWWEGYWLAPRKVSSGTQLKGGVGYYPSSPRSPSTNTKQLHRGTRQIQTVWACKQAQPQSKILNHLLTRWPTLSLLYGKYGASFDLQNYMVMLLRPMLPESWNCVCSSLRCIWQAQFRTSNTFPINTEQMNEWMKTNLGLLQLWREKA